MKTGIIRRIDLGYIVIPPKTQRKLWINEHNPIEIKLENGHILLDLYDCIDNYKDKWLPYLESFYMQNNTPISVFDSKSKPLFSSGIKITPAVQLSEAAQFHLKHGVEYVRGLDIEADEFLLTDEEKYAIDAVVPICSAMDHLGTLVLFGMKNGFPTAAQMDCLKLLARMIAKEME